MIPDIYVHDGTLFRVLEEPEHARITMDVELPILEREEQLEPRVLVFEDVCGYRVSEGCLKGCPTLLDFKVVGTEGRRSWVRLDTNCGFREILCGAVQMLKPDAAV
ncbi:MAG TPA: hypothetical protein VL527_16755 [Dongiaceae bacterium]|jgi:hypothetical protein|nr:hypothetical protein [Dongiaceae bacterium]